MDLWYLSFVPLSDEVSKLFLGKNLKWAQNFKEKGGGFSRKFTTYVRTKIVFSLEAISVPELLKLEQQIMRLHFLPHTL